MGIQIYCVVCPECRKDCWVNNGDIEDLTVMDVEAVQCPWCNHLWLLEGCDDWTDLENAHTAIGGKTPNEAI